VPSERTSLFINDGSVGETALLAEHIAIFRFDGALFFGATPRFFRTFDQINGVSAVIFRLKGITFIDASGAEALAQIIANLEKRGISVLVKGPRAEHGRFLATAGILADLAAKGHIFDDLSSAIAHARRHIERHGLVDERGAM
jgi:SulP family sulfate permease